MGDNKTEYQLKAIQKSGREMLWRWRRQLWGVCSLSDRGRAVARHGAHNPVQQQGVVRMRDAQRQRAWCQVRG